MKNTKNNWEEPEDTYGSEDDSTTDPDVSSGDTGDSED